jgi:hypothetical protein
MEKAFKYPITRRDYNFEKSKGAKIKEETAQYENVESFLPPDTLFPSKFLTAEQLY